MILTCPECATSYFVDDARVPAAGRTVKCSSCGISWKAMRPEPLIGLSAAAGLALAAIAGAGIFRDQIVELAPPTAAAFTAAGLPVNETGLVIEQVKSQAAFQGGRPVLSITGAIRKVHRWRLPSACKR